MVKLHSCRIFKEVLHSRRESQQIIRNPSFSHLREGVIHQPSIQTGNKSTCVKAFVKLLLKFCSFYTPLTVHIMLYSRLHCTTLASGMKPEAKGSFCIPTDT